MYGTILMDVLRYVSDDHLVHGAPRALCPQESLHSTVLYLFGRSMSQLQGEPSGRRMGPFLAEARYEQDTGARRMPARGGLYLKIY